MIRQKATDAGSNPFPIFVLLSSRRCVIVGAGRIGTSKALDCVAAGARVEVIAPRATRDIQTLAGADRLTWHPRAFRAGDVKGAFLVVAATNRTRVNDCVCAAARKFGALCNAVDDPEHCDFFYPAVVRRGPLQIAISTSGRNPALAHRLRVELENEFGPEYGGWVEYLGERRRKILASKLDSHRKRKMIEALVSPRAFNAWRRQQKHLPARAVARQR